MLTRLPALPLRGRGLGPVITILIDIAVIVIDPSAVRTAVTTNCDVIASAATPISMAMMIMSEAKPSTVLMHGKIHPKIRFENLRIGAIETTQRKRTLAAVVIDPIDRTGRGVGSELKEILVEADDVRDRPRMHPAGPNDWKRATSP